jgi:hypothetical protein
VSYWVIKHELVDTYLSAHWDWPGRRWAKFDSDTVKRFASQEAALMVVDTMFPGAIVLRVIESNADAVAQALVEGKRRDILDGVAALNTKLAPHGEAA